MNHTNEFHDYVVHDLMAHIPGITSRRMFGGYGIYQNGVFFALIAEGVLYFKTDDTNRHYFEELGGTPFRYSRKDKKAITMSYFELPESIMEDREALATWVDRSVFVTKNTQKKKHP